MGAAPVADATLWFHGAIGWAFSYDISPSGIAEIHQIGKSNQNQEYSSNAYEVEPRTPVSESQVKYGV
jgi:hypothetical protein